MAYPTVIQGPAWVTFGGYTYYSEGNVEVAYRRDSWEPRSSLVGALGPRHKSTRIGVSFTPVGLYASGDVTKFWPYTASSMGRSAFGVAASTLLITPLSGSGIQFSRAAITRCPSLKLSPLASIWSGGIEFTCLGDIGELNTTSAFQIRTASAVHAFTASSLTTPCYRASFGSVTGIEPDDEGFNIEPVLGMRDMTCANYGMIDSILDSIGLRVRFKPITQDEDSITTLLKLQGTAGYILPGDTYAATGTAGLLTITGVGVSFTASNMGVMDAALVYAPGEYRQGEIALVSKRNWTAGGYGDAVWTFS